MGHAFGPLSLKLNGGVDSHTLLMLHGEDFTDSSSRNRGSFTNVGAVTLDTGKFGKGFYFTREKRLYTSLAADDYLQLGDKDFTIDFWALFRDNLSSNSIFAWGGNTYAQFNFSIEVADGFVLHVGNAANNGYQFRIQLNKHPAYNVWDHYAFVRKGGNLMLFIDGVLVKNTDIGNFSLVPASFLVIAHYLLSGNPTYGINGSIDEFRISDAARWTSNFIPPTQPYW